MQALAPATAPALAGPLPVYDPSYPAIRQNHDWDCSEESIRWCLFAYGRTPDDGWMETSMISAGVISPAVGCTDASGAGLASWVNTEYAEFGYSSSNNPHVLFDAVAAEAAEQIHPLAIGGRNWYHWSGVRGYDAMADRLELANPAPGYHGIYQTMSRDEFAALGPFSLVRVTHPASEAGEVPQPTRLPAGIDVASHQGAVDWQQVRAAGAAFSFTKATGGAWYTNGTLQANWSGMKQAGIQRGAYHFAFESSGQPFPGPGPEAEAQFFLDAVVPLGLDRGDMLVLDIEDGAGPLGHWALRFCRYVETTVGFKPLIYTGEWFASQHGFADVPELSEYGLWQAAYVPTMPAPCAPWGNIAFWQFSDACSVPGVSTPVDGNWYTASTPLVNWGKPGSASPDDPYAPWAGLIGTGLLEMMHEDNTFPAQSRSTWLPLGYTPADVEEAYGQNGVRYAWLLTVGRGFRYAPL